HTILVSNWSSAVCSSDLDDIPSLADRFLGAYLAANDRPSCEFSPEALAALVAHDWPGNVRELQHAVERAAALTASRVLVPGDLPPTLAGPPPAEVPLPPSPLSLQEVVKRHLRRVLTEAGWNKKLAAQILGIHRRTLYRLTKRHGISLAKRGERE